jgi:3-oxoacyl-(acyl-carrier-protein) synthase
MAVYIKGIASITAQHTFNQDNWLQPVPETALTCMPTIEPDYKAFIAPMQIRRMSKVVKMGVAAASKALEDAHIALPDAITIGTAYGCLNDTEVFLSRMLDQQEEMLTPTAFIQSTHNTIAGQIALLMGCNAHNLTYVQRGFSFETALLESLLLLAENPDHYILCGGIDEMTPTVQAILQRVGAYRTEPALPSQLLQQPLQGAIAGDGASCMILAGDARGAYAEIAGLHTFNKPASADVTLAQIHTFLEQHGLTLEDVDGIVIGVNGDERNDSVYHDVLPEGVTIIGYKHLTGEYPTASAFGTVLAAQLLKGAVLPAEWCLHKAHDRQPQNLLVWHHYKNYYHTLTLLKAC